jgi:SAM-dependent methyltransferase
VPPEALRFDRAILTRILNQPAQPYYERRRLYGRVLEVLLAEPVRGLRVLDYGCGTGDWGLMLATEGARVTCLDLSPVAVEVVRRRAAASRVAVEGVARDASDLSCFADAEFDLVYGSAALHHTLKYPGAVSELLRVLKPGGRLVLAETLGNNPLLNWARRARAVWAREPAEAGEEILFSQADVAVLRQHMLEVRLEPMHLLAMAKRLFRGRFEAAPVRGAMAVLEAADRVLLSVAPRLSRYCGEVVVVARR